MRLVMQVTCSAFSGDRAVAALRAVGFEVHRSPQALHQEDEDTFLEVVMAGPPGPPPPRRGKLPAKVRAAVKRFAKTIHSAVLFEGRTPPMEILLMDDDYVPFFAGATETLQ